MKSKIKFTTRLIYCCGFQFQVLCQNFFNATNSKDRPTVDVKNSAKCGANLSAEHWKHWTPSSTWMYFSQVPLGYINRASKLNNRPAGQKSTRPRNEMHVSFCKSSNQAVSQWNVALKCCDDLKPRIWFSFLAILRCQFPVALNFPPVLRVLPTFNT